MSTRVLRIAPRCGVLSSLAIRPASIRLARDSNVVVIRSAIVLTFLREQARAYRVAGWPRCCRDWASLLVAEMRRTAGAVQRISALLGRAAVGGPELGLGPEFVSEFETKRDQ